MSVAGATNEVATRKEAVSKAESNAVAECTEREKQEARVDELRDVKRATLLFAAADTRHNNATALLQYLVAAHHAREAA